MKLRPAGFLDESHINHDGEIMDYIQELHGYLWGFVRAIIPDACGTLNRFVDKSLAQLEEKNDASPTGSTGWICPVCKSVYAIWVGKCSMCGPKTETATTSDWQKCP